MGVVGLGLWTQVQETHRVMYVRADTEHSRSCWFGGLGGVGIAGKERPPTVVVLRCGVLVCPLALCLSTVARVSQRNTMGCRFRLCGCVAVGLCGESEANRLSCCVGIKGGGDPQLSWKHDIMLPSYSPPLDNH